MSDNLKTLSRRDGTRRHHPDKLRDRELWEAFNVAFLQKPIMEKLDLVENLWISRLNATINIQKTFLPKHKSTI